MGMKKRWNDLGDQILEHGGEPAMFVLLSLVGDYTMRLRLARKPERKAARPQRKTARRAR